MCIKKSSYIFVVLIILFVGLSCGPSLVIQHQDAMHPLVTVQIDGEDMGEIEFGDDDSYFVDRGVHEVMIRPANSNTCVWTKDGKGFEIWVDEGALLTLLPPVNTGPNNESSQNK